MLGCDEAIKLDPNDPELYISRGNGYYFSLKLEDMNRAIYDFNQAIRLYEGGGRARPPTSRSPFRNPRVMAAWTYNRRGEYWRRENNLDAAMADFTESIRLYPEAKTYSSRGTAHLKRGNIDQAIDDFSEAIRLDPKKEGHYHCNRGLVYEAKGLFVMALIDIRECLNIKPDDTAARGAMKRIEDKLSPANQRR